MLSIQQNSKKQQAINRNLSVDRERISNACIIGLYVIQGNTITIKLPAKKSKNTLSHFTISKCEIRGEEMEKILMRENIDMKSTNKFEKRNKEVIIFNLLSKEVKGKHFKMAKRTNTTKTIKLNIFREISILNKNGVEEFGRKITESLVKRNMIGKCTQNNFIEIKGNDEEFVEILKEVCRNRNNMIGDYEEDYMKLFNHINSGNSNSYVEDSYEKKTEYNNGRGVFTYCNMYDYSIEYSRDFYYYF